jgi:diguanylate cyclase (GGDEF)-like protein
MQRDNFGNPVNWYGEFSDKQIEQQFQKETWSELAGRIWRITFITVFFYILAGLTPFFITNARDIAFRLIVLRVIPATGAILIYISSVNIFFNKYLSFSLVIFIVQLGLFESYEAVITYSPNLEYSFPFTLLIILFIYLLFPQSIKAVATASIFSSISYIVSLGLWAPPSWMDLIQLTIFFLFVNVLGIYLFIILSRNRRYKYHAFKEIEKLNMKLKIEIADKNEANKKLAVLADTDELTAVSNRRKFNNRLELEFTRAFRYKRPLSLLIFDIDHFKQVNDTYGHDAGDDILIEFTKCCQVELRESDLFARIGGEEFAAILPETPAVGAFDLAERIRYRVSANDFITKSKKINITSSCGTSSLTHDSFKNMEQLIKAADGALYEAKNSGRNKTCSS